MKRAKTKGATGSDVVARRPEVTYETETERTWGGSAAWRESRKRTAAYSKMDWDRIRAEGKGIVERIAAVMDAGAEDEMVQAGIKDYHEYIDRTFYTCSAQVFEGLSELWSADDRFGDYFDGIRPGLRSFLREAVAVYVERLILVGEHTLR